MNELFAPGADWLVLVFLSLLLTAGFALGEIFNLTGVFSREPGFALFFFSLGGVLLTDILSAVAGISLVLPLGIFLWGACLTVLFAEEGRSAVRVFPTC